MPVEMDRKKPRSCSGACPCVVTAVRHRRPTIARSFLAGSLLLTASSGLPVPAAANSPVRNGQHDFDFEIGTWITEVRVLRNPLSGEPPQWAEYCGTSVVKPLLDGRANSVELMMAGLTGRIEGGSLRLYSPKTGRWSLNYASAAGGDMTAPVFGNFDGGGRGVFFGDDTLGDRPIRIRFVITVVSAREARFEQAYSADGGTTWEVNWRAVDRRR